MSEENSHPNSNRETDLKGEESSANHNPADPVPAQNSERKTGLFSDLFSTIQGFFNPSTIKNQENKLTSNPESEQVDRIDVRSTDGIKQLEIEDELINQRLGLSESQDSDLPKNDQTADPEDRSLLIPNEENDSVSGIEEEIGLIGEHEIQPSQPISTPNIEDEISTWVRVNLPYEDDYQFWKERSLLLDDQSPDGSSNSPSPFLGEETLVSSPKENNLSAPESEIPVKQLEGEDEDYWQSFLSGVKSEQKDEGSSSETLTAESDEVPIRMGRTDYWRSVASSLKYEEDEAASDSTENDSEDLELEDRLRQSLFSSTQDTLHLESDLPSQDNRAIVEKSHTEDINPQGDNLLNNELIAPKPSESSHDLVYNWSDPEKKQDEGLLPFSSEETAQVWREDDSYPFSSPISSFEGTEEEIAAQVLKDAPVRIHNRLFDAETQVEFEDIRPEVLEGYEPPDTLPVIPIEKPEPSRKGLINWFKRITTLNKVLIIITALAIPTLFLIASIGVGLFVFRNISNANIVIPEEPVLAPGTSYPIGLKMTGGWYFPLQIGQVIKGEWNPKSAEWLEGTELRKVIGIPWSRQSEAVVFSLKPGDKIELIMNNGDSLFYKVQYPGEIPVSDNSIYSDTKPSLVILLFKEKAKTRWVVVCKQQ